jgi:hypothetical protein
MCGDHVLRFGHSKCPDLGFGAGDFALVRKLAMIIRRLSSGESGNVYG